MSSDTIALIIMGTLIFVAYMASAIAFYHNHKEMQKAIKESNRQHKEWLERQKNKLGYKEPPQPPDAPPPSIWD